MQIMNISNITKFKQFFLSISVAKYMGKSKKEIPIPNSNNHNAVEETDPYEKLNEQTTSKKTSGEPFLNLNYKWLPTP